MQSFANLLENLEKSFIFVIFSPPEKWDVLRCENM